MEQLFIIIDNERKELDLQTPSGINLEFVNNLLTDLSKLNNSYSYTFKLPRSTNNSLILGFMEDARSYSNISQRKLKAEYYLNGINIIGTSDLYISSFEDDCYCAVLSWGSSEGLKNINEHDLGINELPGDAYKAGTEYDEESDDVCSNLEDDFWLGLATPDNYDPTAQTQKVIFSAGYGDEITEDSVVRATKQTTTTYTKSVVNGQTVLKSTGASKTTYFPEMWDVRENPVSSDSFFEWDYYEELWVENKHGIRKAFLPPPVVPVPYLLKKIGDYFGLTIDFDCEKVRNFAVPLIKQECTDALQEVSYIDIPHVIGMYKVTPFDGDHNYSCLMYDSDSMEVVQNTNVPGHCIALQEFPQKTNTNTFTDFKMNFEGDRVGEGTDGVILGTLSSTFGTGEVHTNDKYEHYTEDIRFPGETGYGVVKMRGRVEVKMQVQAWDTTKDAPDLKCFIARRGRRKYAQMKEVGTVKGYVDYGSGRTHPSKGFSGYLTLVYDTSLEYGNDAFESSPFELGSRTSSTDSTSVDTDVRFCFEDLVDDWDDDDKDHKIISVDGNMRVYRTFFNPIANTQGEINVFRNLPEISCMDFIKAVLYACGGQPYMDEDGIIRMRTYAEIKSAIESGDVLDWSDRLMDNNGDDADRNFEADSTTDESLAKVNYFLMKNDEVSDLGVEKQNKLGEAWYKHSYSKLTVDSGVLDEFNTIYQSPFFGAFIRHKRAPKMATGNTMAMYTSDSDSRVDGWQILYNDKPDPILGELFDVNTYTYNPWTGNTRQVSEESNGVVKALKCWQFEGDFTDDPNYWALIASFAEPWVVTEYVNINECELRDLNFVTPIYLAKYNSYFLIRKLTFSEEEGAQAEFMRLSMKDF